MLQNLKLLNRSSMRLLPKKPFLDWLTKIDKEFGLNSPSFDMDDLREDRNIYLLPEFEVPNDFEEYLKENYKFYFEFELFEWYTDPKLFPKNINYQMFKEWFDVEFSSMIIDTLNLPIKRKDY